MKARFADFSERVRQPDRDIDTYKTRERRQVLALCDAVQLAVAKGQQDRVNTLLMEMHAIVDAALVRRRGVRAGRSHERALVTFAIGARS